MRCPNCGNGIERGWSYCPKCGARFRRDFLSSVFGDIFGRMDREFREMDKMMEKNIEALDLSPFFQARPFRDFRPLQKARPKTNLHFRPFRASASGEPQGSGFSIRITRSGGMPPKVSVRTFGSVDRDMVRDQVESRLGVKGLESVDAPPKTMDAGRLRESPGREPKSVEEPKTEVRRLDGRVLVSLEMPGVKSLNDINIMELEDSLEVKAIAGDKAYFKILTKPGQFRLTNRGFSGGVLHLEFS